MLRYFLATFLLFYSGLLIRLRGPTGPIVLQCDSGASGNSASKG